MRARPLRSAIVATLLLAGADAAIAQTSTASPSGDSDRTRPHDQYNVPPPPGYKPPTGRFVQTDREREEDDRYSRAAERWAAANCVADRRSNVAAGAVTRASPDWSSPCRSTLGSGSLEGGHDRPAGL